MILCSSVSYAQTYDLKDYPSGTKTVEVFKAQYTLAKIKQMLDGAELCRNVKEEQRIGMKLQDPDTLENILIGDTGSMLILFECIKKMRQEIVTLKSRLQTAGIP